MATPQGRATRPTTRDEALALYRLLGLPPISGGDGSDEDEAAKAKEAADEKARADAEAAAKAEADELAKLKLDDAGREAIRKEREQRKAASQRAKVAEDELATLRKEREEREAAAKQAADEDAAKRGEFEKLATERAEAITTLTGERDGLKTSLAEYEQAVQPLITALETEIPPEGKEDYDDKATALDRLNWLTTRKALLVNLGTLTADGTKPNGTIRNPANPPPGGSGGADEEAAKKAWSSTYTG